MKFSWLQKEALVRVGAIIDVGDRKIELALVKSEVSKSEPNVVWTHVELLPPESTAQTSQRLKKAIFNAFAAISKDGVKTLIRLGLPQNIDLIQASIHAPYSYTISRSVVVTNPKPMRVTRDMVKDLESKASADAQKMQSGETVRSGLRLYPLSSAPVAIRLNGYESKYPFRSQASEVTLSQQVSLATFDFIAMFSEARDKFLPKAEIDADSFASLFYRTVRSISPATTDCSLLMIGDSSTEFITVRDGLPQTSTFMPMGLNHISAKISQSTGLLPHEAKDLTKNNAIDYDFRQKPDKQTMTASAYTAFEEELKKLLRSTGDVLALPKPIYIQTECDHELFFAAMVNKVAGSITGIKHTVHPVTSEFFACRDVRDASLLSLSYTFHKKLYEDHYLDV